MFILLLDEEETTDDEENHIVINYENKNSEFLSPIGKASNPPQVNDIFNSSSCKPVHQINYDFIRLIEFISKADGSSSKSNPGTKSAVPTSNMHSNQYYDYFEQKKAEAAELAARNSNQQSDRVSEAVKPKSSTKILIPKQHKSKSNKAEAVLNRNESTVSNVNDVNRFQSPTGLLAPKLSSTVLNQSASSEGKI